jgi:hypothetical protein
MFRGVRGDPSQTIGSAFVPPRCSRSSVYVFKHCWPLAEKWERVCTCMRTHFAQVKGALWTHLILLAHSKTSWAPLGPLVCWSFMGLGGPIKSKH